MANPINVFCWILGGATFYSTYNYLKRMKNTTNKFNSEFQTQINNSSPIPMIYGTMKTAGNLVYQDLSDDKKWIRQIVSFGEGKIKSIGVLKFNDLPLQTYNLFTINYSGQYDFATYSYYDDDKGVYHFYLQTYTYTDSGNEGGGYYSLSSILSYEITSDTLLGDLMTWINNQSGWSATDQITTLGITLDDMKEVKTDANSYDYNCKGGRSVVSSKLEKTTYYTQTYLGDGEQTIDSTNVVFASSVSQETRARTVGGLKYDAYLALSVKGSDALNGSVNVTAVVEGRIVKMYSTTYQEGYTLDLTTGFYCKESWSDNPAWCILDFMTSYNGIGLTVDEVDIEYFIKASKFYDQTLSNGQKRFTLNYIVSEKKSRLETVTDMLVCCRSYLGYQNGKYLIIPETHEDTVQVFNPSEINDVEIWWSPMEEIADIIHVKYVDPEYEWVEVVAPARAKEPLRISQPYKIEMDVHGSTNFNQSSRLAWFYLNQSVTEKMYIKFKTDRRALNRTVGDIIEVDGDYILGYTTKKYRIIKFSDAPEGQIEVVCREHNPAIYVECSILDSNGNPAKYSVDANGNFLKDGNGNYIVDNVNGQFLPIDPLGSAEPIVNTTKLPNILNDIPTVTNIAMQESYLIQKNRHLVTNIVGTCTIPSYPFTNRVVVEYNKSGESAWVSGGLVDEGGNFIIRNVETPYYGQTPITYNIRIYVENRLLKKSDYATATIDITGKYTPPTSITTLTATQSAQDKCTINLTWTAISDLDLASYEIREGRTFETSNVIYSPTLNETSYSYKTTESRVYNFYIRALDTSGNYSEVPATCSITLDTHPSSPATITASQLLELNRKYIRINWDSVSDVDINYYQIRVLKDNDLGTWDTATVISDQIKSTTLDYMISENGSYKFLVKAVNNGGVSSVNATVSTAYAFQVIPSTFTLTSIAQASSDRTLVEIKWGECIDSDLLKYEVCLGSTWDDANIIQTTKETSYSYKVSASGITSFLIRAMNTSNFTTTPILAQINVNLTVPTPTCSITGVTSDANNRLIQHLKWDVSPLTDFDHFEICYKTWDDANKVTTKDNFLDWILNQNDSNIVFLVKVVTVAGLSSLALSISAIFHIEPTDVINLSVTRTSVKKSMFDVSWTKVFDTDIAYYEIRVGGESDTWDTATTTYTKVYDYPYQISITTEQVSKVMIKAVSVAGYYSKNACSTTVDTTPTGYSLHPSTPTNVSVIWNTLNRDKVVISWDKINDLDFENYGLRPLGVTWDDASVITTTNNTVTITIPSTGTYTYVLRSKNDIGFYSNEVTVDVGAITLEPSTIDSNSITLTQENDTDKRVVTIKWTGISDIDLKNYIVNIEKV